MGKCHAYQVLMPHPFLAGCHSKKSGIHTHPFHDKALPQQVPAKSLTVLVSIAHIREVKKVELELLFNGFFKNLAAYHDRNRQDIRA